MPTHNEHSKQPPPPHQQPSSPLILIDQVDNLDKHLHSTFRSIASIINYNVQVENLNIVPFLEQSNPHQPPKELLDHLKQNVLAFDSTLEHMERLTTLSIAILKRDLARAQEVERINKEMEAQQQALAPMLIDKPSIKDSQSDDPLNQSQGANSKTPISIQEDDDDDLPLAHCLPPPSKNLTTIDLTTPTPSPQPQLQPQQLSENKKISSTFNLKPKLEQNLQNPAAPSAPSTSLVTTAAQTPKSNDAVPVKQSTVEVNSPMPPQDGSKRLEPQALVEIDRDSSPETALSNAPLIASRIPKETSPVTVTESNNLHEQTNSGPGAEVKSASDLTDGDLFGDGSLFGSSHHGSVGPSPLNQHTNLNNCNLIEKDEVLITANPSSNSNSQPPSTQSDLSTTLTVMPSDNKEPEEKTTPASTITHTFKIDNNQPLVQESTTLTSSSNLIIHPQLNSMMEQVGSSTTTSMTPIMNQPSDEELNKLSSSIDLLATQADLSAFLSNFPNLSSSTDPSLSSQPPPPVTIATHHSGQTNHKPTGSLEKLDNSFLSSTLAGQPTSTSTGLVGLGINLNSNYNSSQTPVTTTTSTTTTATAATTNTAPDHLNPNLNSQASNVHPFP